MVLQYSTQLSGPYSTSVPGMGPDRAYTIGDVISNHSGDGRRRVNVENVLIGQDSTVQYSAVSTVNRGIVQVSHLAGSLHASSLCPPCASGA